MPFLGVEPVQEFASVAKQTITGDGSTSYSLNHSVASANDLAVFVNNVRQEPTSAYTASGGTITFTSALASTDSCYVMYIARTFSSATAEANSIGITELNVSDGTSGQALTTNGSGTLSFSTISSSTPTISEVLTAGNSAANQSLTVGGLTCSSLTANIAQLVLDTVNYRVGIGTTVPVADLDVREGYIIAGTATSTSGSKILSGYYNGSGDEVVTIGTNYSSGALALGYGCYPSTNNANAFLSSADNAAWARGALQINDELVFRNAAATTTTVGSPVTLTERFRIDSSGNTKISNQLYFDSNLGDVISLYDDRLGDATMYGFGVEGSTLFSRSFSLFNWYCNQTADGSSYAMQLNGNGRLTLKGNQNSSNAAQVYFIDDGSPGLVGGIEFTGTFGNGGGYHSSLQTSGELQYSAAGHFFADTSATSSGIPIFWCRMNSDMTIGTFTGSTVLTEYLFDVSAGHLHIDGTLYQNSSSTNSDSKMKENVVTLTNCLNKVSQLRGVEFDWKSEYVREAYHDVGLIAQEVESVIPEVVSEHEIGVGKKAGTGETLKSVDYARLTAVLIEAVKELKTQNEALETRIAALESN